MTSAPPAGFCPHRDDDPVIVETAIVDGEVLSGPRCMVCDFRGLSVVDDDGRDLTDRFVIHGEVSTWGAWRVAHNGRDT
jgi:hypothetical protein